MSIISRSLKVFFAFIMVVCLFSLILISIGVGNFSGNSKNEAMSKQEQAQVVEQVIKWEKDMCEQVADEQEYLIKAGRHDLADIAIDAKQIVDATGYTKDGVSPELLQKFVRAETYNWQIVLQDEESLKSPKWGELKQKHDEMMDKANNLINRLK